MTSKSRGLWKAVPSMGSVELRAEKGVARDVQLGSVGRGKRSK